MVGARPRIATSPGYELPAQAGRGHFGCLGFGDIVPGVCRQICCTAAHLGHLVCPIRLRRWVQAGSVDAPLQKVAAPFFTVPPRSWANCWRDYVQFAARGVPRSHRSDAHTGAQQLPRVDDVAVTGWSGRR